MAVNLEHELSRLLSRGLLGSDERSHLERMRVDNRKFIEGHKIELVYESPFDHGEGHVKSIADIHVGEEYSICRQENTDGAIKIIRETVSIDYLREDGMNNEGEWWIYIREGKNAFCAWTAYQLGLEPAKFSSRNPLWVKDVWVERVKSQRRNKKKQKKV